MVDSAVFIGVYGMPPALGFTGGFILSALSPTVLVTGALPFPRVQTLQNPWIAQPCRAGRVGARLRHKGAKGKCDPRLSQASWARLCLTFAPFHLSVEL